MLELDVPVDAAGVGRLAARRRSGRDRRQRAFADARAARPARVGDRRRRRCGATWCATGRTTCSFSMSESYPEPSGFWVRPGASRVVVGETTGAVRGARSAMRTWPTAWSSSPAPGAAPSTSPPGRSCWSRFRRQDRRRRSSFARLAASGRSTSIAGTATSGCSARGSRSNRRNHPGMVTGDLVTIPGWFGAARGRSKLRTARRP